MQRLSQQLIGVTACTGAALTASSLHASAFSDSRLAALRRKKWATHSAAAKLELGQPVPNARARGVPVCSQQEPSVDRVPSDWDGDTLSMTLKRQSLGRSQVP